MEMKHTLGALQRGWLLIFLSVLAALSVAIWLDAGSKPFYSASASYVVSPGDGIDPDDVARGVDTLDSSRSRSIMATLTEITDSESVRTEAFTALGLDTGLMERYEVDSVVVPEANVMQTNVTGPDPELAAALASTLGELGGVRFVDSYRIYAVEVLDPASVPTEPANPGLAQLLVIAGALGAMVGGAFALLWAAVSGRSDRTVERRLGAYGPEVTQIEEHTRFKRVG